MTRAQLDRSVATRTGESLSVIRRIGFSIARPSPARSRPEEIRLVLACPFCRHQVPYPGRAGNGSRTLAECHGCDVYFDFEDREVYPATVPATKATSAARFLPT